MKIIQWDHGNQQWNERNLAHGMVTELSLKGAIMRIPEDHEKRFGVNPTDEEMDCAAIALSRYKSCENKKPKQSKENNG